MKPRGSWMTTFARFPPGPTPLGPVEVQVADWSQPRPGEAPMFHHALLERLTMAHPALPFALYAPLGGWMVWRGDTSMPLLSVVMAYAGGLLIWSLLEYVAHRGSFHHVPNTSGQVAYGYLVHGVHHAYPDDSRRWVMPLVVTIPIAALIFLLFRLVLGTIAFPVFGGFIHGYLTYDLLHYFIHRGRIPTRLGRYLRQYHLAHHYKVPDQHYGVSSPLWDIVFRTR
jgi:sterol desaturase/sphingolipid hydroxylase (fatty acid hydroxylase superfamily)